jgi:hypothetical protein
MSGRRKESTPASWLNAVLEDEGLKMPEPPLRPPLDGEPEPQPAKREPSLIARLLAWVRGSTSEQ